MTKNEFIKNFIDKNRSIPKSLLKDNNKWMISRCRIEPKLIPEFIYDYIYSEHSNSDLCEIYLKKSRELQRKVKKNYKKSNDMDGNAIVNWFKIKRKINCPGLNIEKITFYDLENIINEYVNDVMTENSFDDIFFKKWNEYYFKIRNNCTYKNIIKELENLNEHDFVREVNKYNKISKIKYISNNKIIQDRNDQKSIELIGEAGEYIAFKKMVEKYGNENVKWISKENKYSPYDLKINLNGDEIYCEVKSTTKPNYFHFFMSRFELNFYENHKKKYWLIFVSNIDNNSYYIPNITIYKNPIIQVSFNKIGFSNNNIYITPYTYYI